VLRGFFRQQRSEKAHACPSTQEVQLALGCAGGVRTHAVEGSGLIGIALGRAGAAGLSTLHLSIAFDEGPFVAPRLEDAILCRTGKFVFVQVPVAVLHVFHEFTVPAYVVALDVEKLRAGARLHLVPRDVAFDGSAVDLLDRVDVARLIADWNAVLNRGFVALPLNVAFPLCQCDARRQEQKT